MYLFHIFIQQWCQKDANSSVPKTHSTGMFTAVQNIDLTCRQTLPEDEIKSVLKELFARKTVCFVMLLEATLPQNLEVPWDLGVSMLRLVPGSPYMAPWTN